MGGFVRLLTRLAELPEIIRTQMEDELNGLLDQEFGDIIATIEAIKNGDFSGLSGSGAGSLVFRFTPSTAGARPRPKGRQPTPATCSNMGRSQQCPRLRSV